MIPYTPVDLSRRARNFVETHGIRVPYHDIRPYREVWLEHGIPAAEIDRAVAFQESWGGLALPRLPRTRAARSFWKPTSPQVGTPTGGASGPEKVAYPWPTDSRSGPAVNSE